MTMPQFKKWSYRDLKSYVLDHGIRMTEDEIDRKLMKHDLVDAAEYCWREKRKQQGASRRGRQRPNPPRRRRRNPSVSMQIPVIEKWTQVGGDVNYARYGGTFAMADGDHIELLKIQPVREYVGDSEAADVGFPFWTKEGYYDLDDLQKALEDEFLVRSMDLENILDDIDDPATRAIVVAEALMDYGQADEGSSGWASDISGGLPQDVVEALEEEDEEFRIDVLGEEEDEEDD